MRREKPAPSVVPSGSTLIWQPQPGPQMALLTSPVPDVFYGGARGGGKTDGLIGDFAAHAARYGEHARGIFFRRTYPEFADIMDRMQAVYQPLGWKFQKMEREWKSPRGAVLRLRHLDADEDAGSYQGHSYTWMGFDELPRWVTPKAIDLLWATLRSPNGVPCVRRSTGNPGGPGHDWVKKRYRLGNAVRQPYVPFDWKPFEGATMTVRSVFIPAVLEDNSYLMKDGRYDSNLQAIGSKALYLAWRYGDWDVVAGAFFDTWDPEKDVITYDEYRDQTKPWFARWIAVDWGYNHSAAVYWFCWTGTRVITYRELVVSQTGPGDLVDLIRKQTGNDEQLEDFWLSPDAFAQRQDDRTIADQIAQVCSESGIPSPVPADHDRVGGWTLMREMLRNSTWQIVGSGGEGGCPRLIEQIPLLQHDPKNLEDVDPAKGKWDEADAARYGLKSSSRRPPDLPLEERIRSQIDPKVDRHSQFMQYLHATEAERPMRFRPWWRIRR